MNALHATGMLHALRTARTINELERNVAPLLPDVHRAPPRIRHEFYGSYARKVRQIERDAETVEQRRAWK